MNTHEWMTDRQRIERLEKMHEVSWIWALMLILMFALAPLAIIATINWIWRVSMTINVQPPIPYIEPFLKDHPELRNKSK